MFLPIAMIAAVESLEEAMRRANDVVFGLPSGFYGSRKEADWFFQRIQAGATYTNRPQGATTGAWPGYQPFGGWKGSGSSGKNAGGPVLCAALHARAEPVAHRVDATCSP
jgi:1-pyrroline-5-carboxylate dehydrogenase